MTRKDELSEVELRALEYFTGIWKDMRDVLGILYHDQDFKHKTRAFFMGAFQKGAFYMAMVSADDGLTDINKQMEQLHKAINNK